MQAQLAELAEGDKERGAELMDAAGIDEVSYAESSRFTLVYSCTVHTKK